MSSWVVGLIVFVVIALIVFWAVTMVYVLQEYERGVVFRLGRVKGRPKGPGLIILLPFGIDRMRKVTIQTVTMNIPPQDMITKDSIRVQADMVVHCRVTDPVRAVVMVQNYLFSTSQVAQAHLRAILGRYELETLLAEPERINLELHGNIARVIHDWGVEIVGVDIRNVDVPGGEQVDYAAWRGQDSRESDAHPNESMEEIASATRSLAASATSDVEATAKQADQEQTGHGRAPKIFLCYRREDTQGFARGIYDNLSSKYGHEQVFRDIDSTPAGIRYSTWIKSRSANAAS